MTEREMGVTYAAIPWRTERWAAIAGTAHLCTSAVNGLGSRPETKDKVTPRGRPIERFDPIDECRNTT